MGPIDYSSMLTQPDFTPLMQGLQLRRQNQALDAQSAYQQQRIDLARSAADETAKREAAWSEAVGGVMANPTTQGYQSLFRFGDKIEAAKGLLDGYTEEQRKRNLTAAMEVGGLINAGALPVALEKLKTRRTALTEAGESTEITDQIIANLESGDPVKITQAKGLAGTVIAMTLGEKAGPVLDTLGYGARAADREEDNERAERVLDLRERATDASIARGDAASARAERAADRADRKAASGGSASSGQYEYRIGPDGKLQRRKR